MSETATYPLVAIVAALREAGMAVSVGDLLDGIEALARIDTPFVALEPVATSAMDRAPAVAALRGARRDQLIWLIQTLWARSDEDRHLVRRVLGQAIAPLPPNHALDLGRVVAGLPQRAAADHPPSPRPPPDEPLTDLTASRGAAPEADDGGSGSGSDGDRLSPEELPADEPLPEAPRIRLPVPPIEDDALPATHLFQLDDTPALDELALAAIWRRFRRPRILPDRRRIDAGRSVDATIRAGGLITIVNATRRVNKARLILMLDAGSAMAPWRNWLTMLAATATPGTSRLDAVDTGYFATIPGRTWHADARMRNHDRTPDGLMERRLGALAGRPMLVFGEAGAARAPLGGYSDRLKAFLKLTRENDIRPVVWINPMPPDRWQPEFRARMAAAPHAEALPLSHKSLIEAIDRLREEAP